MSRAGGNVRRSGGRGPTTEPIRVGRQEMLNLLKAQPGIFGNVASENIEDLAPTIIFRKDGKFTCTIDTEVDILDSDVHAQLTSKHVKDSTDVVRGYLAVSGAQLFLFPIMEDLEKLGDVKVAFEELKREFDGRACVSIGGVRRKDETYADLGSLIFSVPEILRSANSKEVGYLATLEAFTSTINGFRDSEGTLHDYSVNGE